MGQKYQLYRHYNNEGDLLYIGISLSSIARLMQHRRKAAWFDEIANIEIETFDSLQDCKAAEKRAIRNEGPRHNIVYNGDSWPRLPDDTEENLPGMSLAEAAAYLDSPPSFVNSLLRGGYGPKHRKIRGNIRLFREDIDAWMEQHRE